MNIRHETWRLQSNHMTAINKYNDYVRKRKQEKNFNPYTDFQP